MTLVNRLLVIEVATVLLTVLIAGGVSAATTRSVIEADAGERVLGIARALAAAPGVPPAVAARDARTLQPAAEAVRAGSVVSFVTVMDPAGTRLSHPDPTLIGRTYQGTFAPAARGETLVETFPGTLGLSVRAIVPVRAGDGAVVGMVAVGILSVDVAGRVADQLVVLGLGALIAIGLGVLLAVLAARRVRRDTLGLEPHEITERHRHHDAVLHAIREGLLVVDADGRLLVVNDEAVRLLGLPGTPTGRTPADAGIDAALRARLADPAPLVDESHLVGERLLLVNRTTATGAGASSLVVTLRDRTEVADMLRALDDARSVAGALRFQAHEHANHLQAVSTLIELGAHDDARELAVRWNRDLVGTDGLGEHLRDVVDDPALAALVLDKATDARDRGVVLRVADGLGLPRPADDRDSTDRVTVVGNLLDNAIDAALDAALASSPSAPGERGVVELDLQADDAGTVTVRVSDDGPGLADPDAAFTAGWSTKAGTEPRGLGLALVDRVVRRRGGTVAVAAGPSGRGTTVTVALPAVPAGLGRDTVQDTASR